MAENQIKITIDGDPSGLKRATSEAAAAIDKLEKSAGSLNGTTGKAEQQTKSFQETLDKYSGSSRSAEAANQSMTGSFVKGLVVADLVVKAFEKLVDVYRQMKEETIQNQQAELRQQALLTATGQAASGKAESIKKLSEALAKNTKYDDDSIKAAGNLLLIYDLTNTRMERIIKSAANMSVLFGGDLNSNTQQLAKAISEPGESLRMLELRFGRLDPVLKANIASLMEMNQVGKAQDLILAALESKLGNVANDSYAGLERKTIGLAKAWKELVEALGTKIFDDKSKEAGFLERRIVGVTDAVNSGLPTWLKGIDALAQLVSPNLGGALIKAARPNVPGAEIQSEEQAAMQRRAGQFAAAQADADATAARAGLSFGAIVDKYKSSNEQMRAEIDKAKTYGEQAGKSSQEILKIQDLIKAKYATAPAAPERSQFDSAIESGRKALAVATLDLANGTDKLTSSERRLAEVRDLPAVKDADKRKKSEAIAALEAAASIEKQIAAQALSAKGMEDYHRVIEAATQAAERQLEQRNLDIKAIGDQAAAVVLQTAEYDLLQSTIEGNAVARLREAEATMIANGATDAALTLIRNEIIARANLAAAFKGSEELDKQLNKMAELQNQAQSLGGIFEQAFGRAGAAIGGMTNALVAFQKSAADINLKALTDTKNDPSKAAEIAKKAARDTAQAQVKSYADMAGAAKGFFKENTTGYKILEGAEKAFRAVELALAFQSFLEKAGFLTAFVAAKVVGDTTMAASSTAGAAVEVAANGAKAASGAVAAVVNQGNGDPYSAFIRIAAMAAIMAALGFAVSGGGGGGDAGANLSRDRQASAGTGTVFGDDKAKSASIENSLKLLKDNSESGLDYSSGMLSALRNIETGISKMAGTIIRATGLRGGQGDTGGLNLGGSVGGFSGRGRSLADQGLLAGAQTVGGVMQNGFQGNSFSDVTVSTRSWWRTRTHIETVLGELDGTIKNQFGTIISNMRNSVLEAVKVFGDAGEGIGGVLDALQIDIGKISFKGMSAAEIEEQLQAIFGKLGDQMASAAIPGLDKFAKVGEGAYETLIRLAIEYKRVDAVMSQLGMTFGAVGVASIEARSRLVEMTGGLEEFTQLSQYFAQNFLTDAQRLAPSIRTVSTEMARLGLSGITTRDQFADVVRGLDLTSESGAQMYADLMRLTKPFSEMTDYVDSITSAVRGLKDEAYSFARDIAGKINGVGGNIGMANLSSARIGAVRADYEGVSNLGTRQELIGRYVGAIDDWLSDLTSDAQRQAERAAEQNQAYANMQKQIITNRIASLQKELELAKAMGAVADRAAKMLTDITLSEKNPLSQFGRLNLSGDNVDASRAAFAASSGASRSVAAGAYLDSLQKKLELLGQTYQRPSDEYLKGYNDIIAQISTVQGIAKSESAQQVDLQTQIVSLQAAANAIGQANFDTASYAANLIRDQQSQALEYYTWAQTEFAANNAEQQKQYEEQLKAVTDGMDVALYTAKVAAETRDVLIQIRDQNRAQAVAAATPVTVTVNAGGGGRGDVVVLTKNELNNAVQNGIEQYATSMRRAMQRA